MVSFVDIISNDFHFISDFVPGVSFRFLSNFAGTKPSGSKLLIAILNDLFLDLFDASDHVLVVKNRDLRLQPFLKFDIFGIYLVFQNPLSLLLQQTHFLQFFIFFILKVLDTIMHLQYLLSPHPFMLIYFLAV